MLSKQRVLEVDPQHVGPSVLKHQADQSKRRAPEDEAYLLGEVGDNESRKHIVVLCSKTDQSGSKAAQQLIGACGPRHVAPQGQRRADYKNGS